MENKLSDSASVNNAINTLNEVINSIKRSNNKIHSNGSQSDYSEDAVFYNFTVSGNSVPEMKVTISDGTEFRQVTNCKYLTVKLEDGSNATAEFYGEEFPSVGSTGLLVHYRSKFIVLTLEPKYSSSITKYQSARFFFDALPLAANGGDEQNRNVFFIFDTAELSLLFGGILNIISDMLVMFSNHTHTVPNGTSSQPLNIEAYQQCVGDYKDAVKQQKTWGETIKEDFTVVYDK